MFRAMLLQMKEPLRTSSSEPVNLTITDPRAAAVLAHPLHLRYLSPFIGQERRAGEAAQLLDVPLTTLSYRIGRLLELGLLEVTWVEKRTGSPIKHYRAVADAFFVPFAATDAETLEALLRQWEEPWLGMFHRGYARALEETKERWGVRVWRDEGGEMQVAPTSEAGRTRDIETDGTPALLDALVVDLKLDAPEAGELRRELLEVIRRYSGKGGMERHFLRVMLTPIKEDEVLR